MLVTARDVAGVIPDAEIVGNPSAVAGRPAPLSYASSGTLSWLKPGAPLPRDARPSILIGRMDAPVRVGGDQALVCCDNPRLGLAYTLEAFFAAEHAQPVIERDPSATVHASAVIGEPGMAYEWDDAKRRWVAIPHVAGVVIGPEVDIGPCACVMRGLLQDTVIKRGCKVGNHATVGHGAIVGPDVVLCPHVVIGGSASVRPRAFIGVGAKIRPGVTIGNAAVIGQEANVVCDVPAGETWYGNPATRRMR